jgi:hypothetical protein
MRNLNLVIILSVFVALGFIFTGCGSTENMLSEMSGTWKSDKNSAPVNINLAGEQKAIEIGGNTVPVTVNKVDEGAFTIKVDAKPTSGKTSVWSLRQVWNDNGSAFTIKFGHDGEEETLTRG